MAKATKRNWRKIILRLLACLFILSFILPLLSRLIPMGLNKEKTSAFFGIKNIAFKDTLLQFGGRKVRFVCAGNDTLPMVLFIHGSPGSWDAFKDYLSDTGLLSLGYLVAADRLGYGGSGGQGEASLQIQADAMSLALKLRKNNAPITVIGHSYGGPVAVKFALEHAALTKQVILISPTISPEIEENIGYKRNLQKMSKWGLWHWTLSRDIKNCVIEMQPLPTEIRAMEKDFARFNVPITEIHGTNDALAPFGNQLYVKNKFIHSAVDTICLTGKDHFIPFTMPGRMIEIIKERLK